MGQVTHALLTRPPLSHLSWFLSQQAVPFIGRGASFDLHVLSTPPAFILSQDQTLMLWLFNRQNFARVWLAAPVSVVSVPDHFCSLFLPHYPVRFLFRSFDRRCFVLKRRFKNWIGLFENHTWTLSSSLDSKNVFWFFKVVSLFNYQGSIHRFSSRKRLLCCLSNTGFRIAPANIILSDNFTVVNTFFD